MARRARPYRTLTMLDEMPAEDHGLTGVVNDWGTLWLLDRRQFGQKAPEIRYGQLRV